MLSSSEDADPRSADVPFKQRIRPGMVVRWTPPGRSQIRAPGGLDMAVVLCPQSAAGAAARNFRGELVNEHGATSGEGNGERKPLTYLCALVLPSVLPEAYEIHLWRQAVVDVDSMEAEVLLEYDVATRYYFMKI
jgi:kinesin family protein 2/24